MKKNLHHHQTLVKKIAKCLWNMKFSILTGHDYPWLAWLAMTGLIGLTGQLCGDWPTLWRLAKTGHYCPDTGQLWLHWLILTWLANTVSTGLTSQTGQYCPNWLDWPTLCWLAKTGRYCPETGQLWLNWLILTWLANTVPTGLTSQTGQYCPNWLDWPDWIPRHDWPILFRLANTGLTDLTGQ